jgi:hypothetical protein
LPFALAVSGARNAAVTGRVAPNPLKNFVWHCLFAKQILQILLFAWNSFPKQEASENFGSRMTSTLTLGLAKARYSFTTFPLRNGGVFETNVLIPRRFKFVSQAPLFRHNSSVRSPLRLSSQSLAQARLGTLS